MLCTRHTSWKHNGIVSSPTQSSIILSATTLSPRDILHVVLPGITEASVTKHPARTRVSWMPVVSISSEPSAIGTSTDGMVIGSLVGLATQRKLPALQGLVFPEILLLLGS